MSRRSVLASLAVGGAAVGYAAGQAGDLDDGTTDSLYAAGIPNLTSQYERSKYFAAPSSVFDKSAMETGQAAIVTDDFGLAVKDEDGNMEVPPFGSSTQPVPSVTADVIDIAQELGLPVYDDVSNAPATDGRIVYVTGDGETAPEGLYQRQSGSYVQVGAYTDEDAQDAVGGNLGPGLEYDDPSGAVSSKEPVVYDPGMTEWEDALSNEEVWRVDLQADETLLVERIEFRQKGGGSSASASIDVRDVTGATTIGSQTLGGTTKDPGSSGVANTVVARVTNSTGGPINAAPRVVGYIGGA